jgi:hypothetical protein
MMGDVWYEVKNYGQGNSVLKNSTVKRGDGPLLRLFGALRITYKKNYLITQ